LIKYIIHIDCKNANGNVNHLVYFCICICQTSPSSCNSSNLGTTAVSNCIIIDALMKGIKPTAIIENCSNVHPKSIAKNSKPQVVVFTASRKISIFTKGTGITTNNLYITNQIKVYNNFFLIDFECHISNK